LIRLNKRIQARRYEPLFVKDLGEESLDQELPDVTNKSRQKVCKFTVSSIRNPKQKFAFYELVPLSRRRGVLIESMEKELRSELSGYKVTAVEILDTVETQRDSPFSQAIEEDPDEKSTVPKLNGYFQKLEHLSSELGEIRGVKSLIFVDKAGRVIYRGTRKDQGGASRMDSARIWDIAKSAYSLFETAQAGDKSLGETQFIVIGRKEFKAVFVPIPSLQVIMRIAIENDQDARMISDQARSLIVKHTS
jgi:hypothetical protein